MNVDHEKLAGIIAEQVCGWHRGETPYDKMWISEDGNLARDVRQFRPGERIEQISVAAEIWRKKDVDNREWGFSSPLGDVETFIAFVRDNGHEEVYYAEDPALALCLAFLEWLGVECPMRGDDGKAD